MCAESFNSSVDVLETMYEEIIQEELPNYITLWKKFTALKPIKGGGLVPYEVKTPKGLNSQELRENLLELQIAAYSLLANLIYAKKWADLVPEKVVSNEGFLEAWDQIETVYLRLGNVRMMWGKLWKEVRALGYGERISEGSSIKKLERYLAKNDRTDLLGNGNQLDIGDIIDRRNHLVHHGVRAIWTSDSGRLAIVEKPKKGESWVEENRSPHRILAQKKVVYDVRRTMNITNKLIGVFTSVLEEGLKGRGVRIVQ